MKRILPTPLLSLALFAVWLLLNRSVSAGHLILGTVLAVAIPLLTAGLRPMRVRVRRRDAVVLPGAAGPALKLVTIETARSRMPGWDIYALEAEWRDIWHRSGRPSLRSPDAAFLGWLKKRA